MKSLEVIRGKLDISTAATASILVASSDERETKVANSTTSTAAHSAAQDVSLVAPVADLDSSERELDATSGTGFNSVCGGSALAVHFAPASPIPSPASASPQDVDLGFQSGVTELSYTHDPLFSTDGDLCILFDGDDGDVDHLSRLPDSLLRDIVARLPIKDAGRTAVLSRRWSILWRAAPLLVGHADLVVLRLNSMSDDISMGVAATNDSAEQASTPALMPALKYPRSIASTSADSGAAAAMANQWVIDRLSFHSFEWAVPNKLFDRPPARALKFLVRPYDPGAGFVGGARVGVCFDTEEVQLDRGKTIAMGLLRRSARTWPADLRTGIGTMLDVVLVPRSPIGLQQQDCAHLLLANNDPDGCFPASNASWPPESAGTKSWLRRPLCWTTRQCPPSLASAAITARVHTSVRHLSDTVIQLAELQDVTGASPIGNLELLSAMHTKCSMKGHDSNEVTLLSLCSFFMTVVAIEGTLHHKEYRSEWLRILLLSFGSLAMSIPGVFMDWLEQPWPPPMLVEIVGSEVEDSNIKLRPTPWPYFCSSCYLVEVQSKGHWALVGFVSLDFCSSKEKMAWYCCLQFMLVTSSACASSPAMHTDVDLEKIDWGSCCAYLIFNALTSWFPVEVARAGESIAAQLDAACQDSCLWRGNDCADGFHFTTSVLQDQKCCRYAVQLHVDCILTWQMQRNQTKYEKLWGTDELPIAMGDMSYSTSEIMGLNIQEAVTTDNSKFGLSRLALLLLLGKHSEKSSCQVSVEHILQWPPPNQNKFISMLVELAIQLELLMEMSMTARVELFTDSVSMNDLLSSGWNVQRTLQSYGTVFSFSEQREGDSIFELQVVELVDTMQDVRAALLLMPLFVSDILSGSEQAIYIQCQNNCSETTCFRNVSMQQILLQDYIARVQGSQTGQSIMSVPVIWDPGGSTLVYCNGLGASRILRGGVCHIPTDLWLVGWRKERAGLVVGWTFCLDGVRQVTRQYKMGKMQQQPASKDQNLKSASVSSRLAAARVTLFPLFFLLHLPVHVPRTF